MKKIMIIAALAALAGCTSTTIETAEWKAKVSNHWFAKDVDKLSITKGADGSYQIDLNGYREDVSEKLPAFTKEVWLGLGVIGRLAAATVNPTAAGVPLTTEAANADEIAKLVKAKAEAEAELAKAKTALKANAAKNNCADGTPSGDCADGSCKD